MRRSSAEMSLSGPPVEEGGELTIVPFLLSNSRPTRQNLLRYWRGMATGLVIFTAFLLGGAVLVPLVLSWIRVIG